MLDIFGAIMDFVSSSTPLFHQVERDTTIKEEDSEVVAMIKELLDTRIRPTIQDDGGDVEYVSFQDGVVKLRLRFFEIDLNSVGALVELATLRRQL
jgi:NFU1 iron-sulfur cluster scaffold homolog, mitochondrial